MKRVNGILGASLAGFAALTIAAITTTTTEAIAFKATGARLRVAAPRVKVRTVNPLIYRSRVVSTIPAVKTHSVVPPMTTETHMEAPVTVKDPVTSVMGEVRVPTDHSLPETKLQTKHRKLLDSKLETLKEVFAGVMVEELFTPFPGLDPTKIFGHDGPDKSPDAFVHDPNNPWLGYNDTNHLSDISWRSCRWNEATWDKVSNWGSGRDNPLYTEGTELWRVDNCDDTNKGSNKGTTNPGGSSGKSADTKPQEDSGGDKPKDEATQESEVQKEKDNANGGEGDDGNDPDEMRNTVRDEHLNINGMEGVAAMGGDSGSNRDGAAGNTPQRPDGSGWERHRRAISGRGAADPEDIVDPTEMANPMGTSAAGINLRQGQAMSPTVDDQQNGNGPSGPIGPVATQTQAETVSVEMSSHLTAAMSDPMASPTVDDQQNGNGPGGPIGPVADQ